MLNLMLQPDGGIRREDVRTLFSNLAATSVGNSIAVSFLINRWDDIEKAYNFHYISKSRPIFVNFFNILFAFVDLEEAILSASTLHFVSD